MSCDNIQFPGPSNECNSRPFSLFIKLKCDFNFHNRSKQSEDLHTHRERLIRILCPKRISDSSCDYKQMFDCCRYITRLYWSFCSQLVCIINIQHTHYDLSLMDSHPIILCSNYILTSLYYYIWLWSWKFHHHY
jgi:hypothetical protein